MDILCDAACGHLTNVLTRKHTPSVGKQQQTKQDQKRRERDDEDATEGLAAELLDVPVVAPEDVDLFSEWSNRALDDQAEMHAPAEPAFSSLFNPDFDFTAE